MTDAEKETLIRKLYFNESGFGSPFQIYKEAKLKIPTITLDFIRNYLKTIIPRSKPTGGGKTALLLLGPITNINVMCFILLTNNFKNKNINSACLA